MPPHPKISTRDAIARYHGGELILPQLLRELEDLQHPGERLGTVVVATLPGDVHHIGTALLVTLFECAGYRVHDLGLQARIDTIIDTAVRVNADAIALSALLVTSSRQMPLCIQALDARGLQVPVLVGGAAINRAFGRQCGVLPDGRVYAAGVFYCRDVFEGLAAVDAVTDPARRTEAIEHVRDEIAAERDQLPQPRTPGRVPAQPVVPPSQADVPTPPYFGARRRPVELREVWRGLDRNVLFRFHWGGYRAPESEYDRLVSEFFEPTLSELTDDAIQQAWLQPRIASGYYACRGDANSLQLIDHEVRLEFPRQSDGEHLCLADYFDSSRDVVALQAVTVGPQPGDYVQALQRDRQYLRMLLVNGLASATAEALAEYTHRLTRADLGLAPERGLRYSWGFAACPDLGEQRKVLPLLGAETEIGLQLTESDTLDPEHSTVAIVVHHPEAKYFAVR